MNQNDDNHPVSHLLKYVKRCVSTKYTKLEEMQKLLPNTKSKKYDPYSFT